MKDGDVPADHILRALNPKQPGQERVDVCELAVHVGHAEPLRGRFDETPEDCQFLLRFSSLFHFRLQAFIGFP